MGMKYITVIIPGNIYFNYLNYGALTLILFEPQFGHSVAPFFTKVFLHETHQNMELPFFISSRSSGIIENPEYVLHITTSIYYSCIMAIYGLLLSILKVLVEVLSVFSGYPFILSLGSL
jgi:hypothetical protein